MKRSVVAFAFAVTLGGSVSLSSAATAAAGTGTGSQVAVTPAGGQAIPGQYVVTLRAAQDPAAVARALAVVPRFVYDTVLNGFAARLTAGQLRALQRSPNVVRIEQDAVFHAVTTQYMDSNGDPWGLDRIDQRSRPLSGSYTYTHTGSGVRAYVIDTGIATADSDFGGRASDVYDALGGNGQDCNGHGTHVAGTIGGTKYGVAKSAYLRGVRVLDCSGSGATSGIIAGINWVASNAIHPAVANMSLGGGYSSSLNSATTSLVNSGVFTAVAAGNSNADACNYSPASASGTLTVAASDRSDVRASFSNYGGCVDVYAPGVAIKSDWLNGGTNTISGTSMASPHAAGVGALYKSTYGDAASSTIVSWIVNNATTNVISSNPSGTPNRLLYKNSL
ncbi:MAG: S8 family peptidase [Mycobacteriales bacterium]